MLFIREVESFFSCFRWFCWNKRSDCKLPPKGRQTTYNPITLAISHYFCVSVCGDNSKSTEGRLELNMKLYQQWILAWSPHAVSADHKIKQYICTENLYRHWWLWNLEDLYPFKLARNFYLKKMLKFWQTPGTGSGPLLLTHLSLCKVIKELLE